MHHYISTFPGKSYDWLVTVRASFTLNKAVWSSGMIPALGAGGPEFDPRLRPFCLCFAPTAGTHRGSMRTACAVAPTARHTCVHRPRRTRAVAATSADWNGRRRATTASSVVDLLELSDASDEAMRALVPSAWREDDAATSHDRHPGEPTTRPRSAIIDPGLFDDAERPAFRMASRSRLTPVDARRFPGDDAFSTIARAVCDADALPRKELFETWHAAIAITDALGPTSLDADATTTTTTGFDPATSRTTTRRRHRRVMDLAGGHGFLAMCLLIINPRLSSAVVVDRRKPDSHERLVSSLANAFPASRVHARLRYVEASIADATPTPCTTLVSVHACGDLSDLVLKLAAEARSPVAVVPCCHRGLAPARAFAARLNAAVEGTSGVEGTGGSGPSPICPSAAMDVARLELLRRAGFRVHARTIPREITPKNRVIVGAAAAATARDEDDEHDASPGWRSVADTIPASPWKWHVVGP